MVYLKSIERKSLKRIFRPKTPDAFKTVEINYFSINFFKNEIGNNLKSTKSGCNVLSILSTEWSY